MTTVYTNLDSIEAAYLAVGAHAAASCRSADFVVEDLLGCEAMAAQWNRLFDVASALHVVRMYLRHSAD